MSTTPPWPICSTLKTRSSRKKSENPLGPPQLLRLIFVKGDGVFDSHLCALPPIRRSSPMKRFLVPAMGALLTLLAGQSAFGQAAKTLTLQGSIDLALEKNVFVTQARNTLEAQQSARHAAVGAMLPSLDLSGSFSRSQSWSSQSGGVIFYQGIPISTGTGTDFRANNSFSTGISSQVTLFNGFANTSRVSQSQSNAAAADFTLNRTEQTTINTTVQLYLD